MKKEIEIPEAVILKALKRNPVKNWNNHKTITDVQKRKIIVEPVFLDVMIQLKKFKKSIIPHLRKIFTNPDFILKQKKNPKLQYMKLIGKKTYSVFICPERDELKGYYCVQDGIWFNYTPFKNKSELKNLKGESKAVKLFRTQTDVIYNHKRFDKKKKKKKK